MKRYSIAMIFVFMALMLGCSKGSSDEQNPHPVDKTANLKGTGESANDILSNSNFDKLLIEIAYVDGFRPTQAAINDFVAFLKERTFKENIEVIYSELDSPNKENLSLEEISQLEIENRTAYNRDKTLAVYIYFADAPSDEDKEEENLVTLGAVYRNTSMVIYEKTVRDLAAQSFLIYIADVETSTLNHEFGHLFGLVNLGTTSINDHEDPEAQNHCIVLGCLMRAELQFGGFDNGKGTQEAKIGFENGLKSACSLSGQSMLQILEHRASKGLANASGLDSECILDLQSNGGR